MSLLGLDVGTTGCKALVLGVDGRVLAYAYREYPFEYPKAGWAELNPLRVWHAVQETVREAAGQAGGDKIQALSISSHGESITPVGACGQPLHNTIASLDTRTAPYVKVWEERFGRERIQRMTGIPLHHKHSINRLMWLRDNRPDVYRSAWKFLCYEDFILLRLGLEPVIGASLAARTMAYDPETGTWSPEILSLAGVDAGRLPRVQPAGRVVGEIPESVAEDLGLGQGVLAVTGGHDQPCGALGAGIVQEGPAVDSLGTVEALTAVVPGDGSPEGLLRAGYPRYPHVVDGEMVTMAVNPNGGALFRWYRDNLAGDERAEAAAGGRDPYEIIVEKCPETPSGVFVLPHFAGSGTPNPNPALRGAIMGMSLGTTRHEIAWAVLESAAFELRMNLNALERSGVDVCRLAAVGGGARSRGLLQLRANVLGIPVVRPAVSEAACLGAAMLAGYGAGVYRSLAEATVLVGDRDVFDPQPGLVAQYARKFEAYARLREAAAQIQGFLLT